MVYLSCKAIVHRGEYRVAESLVQFRVTCILTGSSLGRRTHSNVRLRWLIRTPVKRYQFLIDAVSFLLLGQGPVEPSSTNKPLAMRVVEDALAYSKKPPVI